MKIIAFAVVLLTAGCALNRSESGGPDATSQTISGSGSQAVPAEDSNFAAQACQAGTAEIEIARLATRNTRNQAVRSFAKRLAEDHAQAEKELGALFSRKGIPPLTGLSGDWEDSMERLAQLKGREFDQAFKQQVIADHEKVIALFEKQADQGEDPDLKLFAQKHLPHLREHLATARALPISNNSKGPPADSPNAVLQNPATRLNIPR